MYIFGLAILNRYKHVIFLSITFFIIFNLEHIKECLQIYDKFRKLSYFFKKTMKKVSFTKIKRMKIYVMNE